MDAYVLEQLISEFSKRYLTRYKTVVKKQAIQPLVGSALWLPSVPHHPFLGVSMWFQRELDPFVVDELEEIGELTPHHGKCAEPVSISKALRWLRRNGVEDLRGALRGGHCYAMRIELTGSADKGSGSFNPNTNTFGFRQTFGDPKPACASCQALLQRLGIIEVNWCNYQPS